MINTAVLAVVFYLVFSYSLGAGAALAWRYSPSPARWVPGALTALYYVLAWLFPHRVIKEALSGTASPGDDVRFIVSAAALFVTVFLLGQALQRGEKCESEL